MDIKIWKNELLKRISMAMRAVTTNERMPLLGCVLIDASQGDIRFITNNTELAIETIVDGDILSSGMVALEAKMFESCIRKIPDGEVRIQADDGQNVLITSQKTLFRLAGPDDGCNISLPQIPRSEDFSIKQADLKMAISQTVFATDAASYQKIFNGIQFLTNRNVLQLTATDGRIIAVRFLQMDEDCPEVNAVVPAKAATELNRVMNGGADENVSFFFSKSHVVFEFENTTFIARLITDPYISVNRYLSDDSSIKVTVGRKALLGILDRSTLLVRESDKRPIIMEASNGTLEVKIATDIGKMREEIEADMTGPDIKIGFNPKLLLGIFKALDGEDTVSLCMETRNDPCYIRDDEGRFIYMVLPVKFAP